MRKMNSRLDLEHLRKLVFCLEESFYKSEPKSEYGDLIDEFASVYGHCLRPFQIEAVRREPEYFLKLIDLARQKRIQ